MPHTQATFFEITAIHLSISACVLLHIRLDTSTAISSAGKSCLASRQPRTPAEEVVDTLVVDSLELEAELLSFPSGSGFY